MRVVARSEAGPGEPSELEKLFIEHNGRVFRAAYRLTGSVQDAEDVLQTVFLRLAQQAGGSPVVANVASYLYRAAINASIDLLRARKARVIVGLEEAEKCSRPDAVADSTHAAAEIRAWLRSALGRLTPREGEVFALRYLEGRANKDIARMLGVSRLSVAVVLHRARRRIQKEFRVMDTQGGRR